MTRLHDSYCNTCHRSWPADPDPDAPAVIFHRCLGSMRRSRQVELPPWEWVTGDEMRQEAWRSYFEGTAS